MRLDASLSQRPEQGLAITPQVIQSIKLLKFGQEDLYAFLREQEERNPLIEVVATAPERAAGGGSASSGSSITSGPSGPASTAAASDRTPLLRPSSGNLGVQTSNNEIRTVEDTCASGVSLREWLLQQVECTIRHPAERLIARDIAESIDPDGYLRRDLDEIAETLGVSERCIERVLRDVQTLEPAGVGARSLSECLRLQLREADRLCPAMEILLDHLDLLANCDLTRLSKVCNVEQSKLAEMVHIIRSLDPRPGLQFDGEPTLPALPDLKLSQSDDGAFHVELNSTLLPRVLVDREYYAELRSGTNDEDDTRFVVDCMRNATWLTRNLDQRARTILAVATEIVKRQKAFFLHGVEHMKPLNQSDVAEAVGLHPSTVCRATSNKYIMTDRGMFELKYFFSNEVGGEDAAGHASESIRSRIRVLIQNEESDKVLSDEHIATILRDDGVNLARRTVAKYREMMNIPSSQMRRRQKKAAALKQEFCAA